MNKDKVSIIIPVYNTEKYIKRCLDSVINQTYKNIEIIIINDGSTDKSEKIIKETIKNQKNVIYKKIKNSGVANARNVALDLVSGDYIAFVDSDDYPQNDMIEKLLSYSKNNNCDIVCSGYRKIFKDGEKEVIPDDVSFYDKKLVDSKEILLHSNPYITNKLFKMTIVGNIRFNSKLRIFEDLVFTYELFLLANKIGFLNECLYNYNVVNETSLTRKFSEKMFDIFDAMDELKQFYKENSKEDFDEELEFLAIKHMMLRIKENCKDKKLKLKYIDNVYDYLNKNNNKYKNNRYFKMNKKNKFKKYKSLMKIYAIIH